MEKGYKATCQQLQRDEAGVLFETYKDHNLNHCCILKFPENNKAGWSMEMARTGCHMHGVTASQVIHAVTQVPYLPV